MLEASLGDDGKSSFCLPPPCPSGFLRATGPALSQAHQVANTADSLSEHWPKHNAYQPRSPQADGLHHVPTSVLPGKHGRKI